MPVTRSHCIFQREGGHFSGSCGALFGQIPAMMLRSVPKVSSGAWRHDIPPTSTWTGDMTDEGYPNDLLELEVFSGGKGELRTEYGWFPVTDFTAGSAITFTLDPSREVAPGPLDLEIVKRAAIILSIETAWNRSDNRKCPADAMKWSIYCALEKAEIDVTGGFHHRRPAAEVVRQIVDQRTRDRNYHHRLMEYNNDPTTHLQDVQSLFQQAEAQIAMSQQTAVLVRPSWLPQRLLPLVALAGAAATFSASVHLRDYAGPSYAQERTHIAFPQKYMACIPKQLLLTSY